MFDELFLGTFGVLRGNGSDHDGLNLGQQRFVLEAAGNSRHKHLLETVILPLSNDSLA